MITVGQIQVVAKLKDQMSPGLKTLDGKLKKTGQSSGVAASKFGGLVSAITPLRAGVAGAAAALGAFAKKGVQFNKMVESATTRFQRFFPNVASAEKHVRQLTEFAAKTPFQLEGITKASQHLKTFGGHALGTQENLRVIGDAAASVNQPIEDVAFWVGRMYTNLDGGKPIGEAAARLQEMGLLSGEARRELEELAEEGAGAAAGMDALKGILASTEGGMLTLSQTTAGLESTFSDLASQMAGAFSDAIGLTDGYKAAVGGMNSMLEKGTNWLRKFSGDELVATSAKLKEAKGAQDNLTETIQRFIDKGAEVPPYLIRERDERQKLIDKLTTQTATTQSNIDAQAGLKQSQAEAMQAAMAARTEYENLTGETVSLKDATSKLAEWKGKAAERTDAMMAAQKAEAEAAREAKKAHDAMVASLQAAEKGTFRQTNARLVEMKQHLEGVDQSFSDVVATGMPKFTQALVGLQPTVKQNMETLGDEGGGSFMSGIFEKLTGGGTEGGLSGMMDRLGIGGGKSLITGFMNQMTGQGEGGGGLMDRLGNLMQTIQGGWQAAVTAGLNMVPVVGPLMATFGPALMKGINGLAKKVWGGIKRLFGGPSAADLQAREMFDALGNAAHDTLGDMRSYQREYNDAISKGWDEQNAKARAAFMVRGEIEGKSRAESFRDYERFQNAMESENHDTLESMTDNWNQWYLDWSTGQSSQVTTSSTTTDALVADSQRQGEAFESTADRGTSGFDQMQQSMSNSFSQIGAQAKSVAAQVNAALGSIKTNITVKINYVQTGAVPEGARGAGGGGEVVVVPAVAALELVAAQARNLFTAVVAVVAVSTPNHRPTVRKHLRSGRKGIWHGSAWRPCRTTIRFGRPCSGGRGKRRTSSWDASTCWRCVSAGTRSVRVKAARMATASSAVDHRPSCTAARLWSRSPVSAVWQRTSRRLCRGHR